MMDESIDDSWDYILNVLVTAEPSGDINGQYPIDEAQPHFSSSYSVQEYDSEQNKQNPSKKRKANPDADDIAKATEDALLQLGLDPNSEEFKLKKRQIRNRISAQSHRDRKNHHINELSQEITIKNQRIEQLEQENILLKQENEQLRCLVMRIEVSRTSSELTARTDLESRGSPSSHRSFITSEPSQIIDMHGSSSNSSSAEGSQTPDYSVTSTSSSSSLLLSTLPSLPQPMPSQSSHTASAFSTHTSGNGNNTSNSSGSSLSTSNPILKSLSFICVLCVLCLCSNMSNNNPNNTSATSNNPFLSATSSLLAAQQEDEDGHGLHRRLLATARDIDASPALLQTALDLLRATTISAPVDASSLTQSSVVSSAYSPGASGSGASAGDHSHRSAATASALSAVPSNLRRRQSLHSSNHTMSSGSTSPNNSNNNSSHVLDYAQLLRSLVDPHNSNDSTASVKSAATAAAQYMAAAGLLWSPAPLLLPDPQSAAGHRASGSAMQVVSKSFLPFPVTQGAHEDWFSYHNRLQALSSSQVFVQNGIALLDPAFRPSDRLAALLLQAQHAATSSSSSPSRSQQHRQQPPPPPTTTAAAAASSAATAVAAATEQVVEGDIAQTQQRYLPLPLPARISEQDAAMDVDEVAAEEREQEPLDDEEEEGIRRPPAAPLLLPLPATHRHSPAATGGASATANNALDLVVPRLSSATSVVEHAGEDENHDRHTSSGQRSLSRNHHHHHHHQRMLTDGHTASDAAAAAAAASSLIAESNMMTLTIPASVIKLGRSLHDTSSSSSSSNGDAAGSDQHALSMESLLRLFNLTLPAVHTNMNTNLSNNNNTNTHSNVNPQQQQQQQQQPTVTLQNAWVEMNCIVVGAKVLWQALPPDGAGAAAGGVSEAAAATATSAE